MRITGWRIPFQVVLLGVLLACPAMSQVRKGGETLKCPVAGSFGVLNGMAIEKPSPVYPDEAKKRGITGSVAVFVLVDKRGIVRRARACSGPQELRGAAEDAAFKARLRLTILSGKAVENRGVLTYAFPPVEKSSDSEPAPNKYMRRTRATGCLLCSLVWGSPLMPGVRLLL